MENRLIFQQQSGNPSAAPSGGVQTSKEKAPAQEDAKKDLSTEASFSLLEKASDEEKKSAESLVDSFGNEDDLKEYLDDDSKDIKERLLVMGMYIVKKGPITLSDKDGGTLKISKDGVEIKVDNEKVKSDTTFSFDNPGEMEKFLGILYEKKSFDPANFIDASVSTSEEAAPKETQDDTIFGIPKNGKFDKVPRDNEWGQYYYQFKEETEQLKASGNIDPVELQIRQLMLYLLALGAYAGHMGNYFTMMKGDYEKIVDESGHKDEKLNNDEVTALTDGINNGPINPEDYKNLSKGQASIKYISKTYLPFETTEHTQLSARLKNPTDTGNSVYEYQQAGEALKIKDAKYIPEGTVILFTLGGANGEIVAARSTGSGNQFEYYTGGDSQSAVQFDLFGDNCPFKTDISLKAVFYPKFITNLGGLDDADLDLEAFYKSIDPKVDKSPIGRTLSALTEINDNYDLMHSFNTLPQQKELGVVKVTSENIGKQIEAAVNGYSNLNAAMEELKKLEKTKLFDDLHAKGKAVISKFVGSYFTLIHSYVSFVEGQKDDAKKAQLQGFVELYKKSDPKVREMAEYFGVELPKAEEEKKEEVKADEKADEKKDEEKDEEKEEDASWWDKVTGYLSGSKEKDDEKPDDSTD